METIAKLVLERLRETQNDVVPVGVSNWHMHLSQADLETLFGSGYQLTSIKELRRPNQFAVKETVTIIRPKGGFENVCILGLVRPKSQMETSLPGSFRPGIEVPIREPGQLENTSGLQLYDSLGTLELPCGVIVALYHIHATPEVAKRMGTCDKEIVEMKACGERHCVLRNVLARVSENSALEIHVDIGETDACGLKNGDYIPIRRCR